MKNKIIDEAYKEEVLPMRKFYPLLYVFLLIIILILGLYFVANFNIIFTNKYIPYEQSKTKVEEDVPFEKASTSVGINLEKYATPSDSLIAKGKDLFASTCSPCHGETGHGDGPAAAALNPKPRNFHAKDGWTNGRTFSDIFKTLKEGISKNGMASYDGMSVEDRIAIIHYIRTFENDFPKITPDEIKQLDDTYHLTRSGTSQNTIPIEVAMQKIIDDNSTKVSAIQNILKSVEQNKTDEGAVIFNIVSNNKFRSLYFIFNAKNKITTNENFIKEVTCTIPENGFKDKVLRLSKEKQQILFDYFIKILK